MRKLCVSDLMVTLSELYVQPDYQHLFKLQAISSRFYVGKALPTALYRGEVSAELNLPFDEVQSGRWTTGSDLCVVLSNLRFVVAEMLYLALADNQVPDSYSEFIKGYLDASDIVVDYYNKVVLSLLVASASLLCAGRDLLIPRQAEISLNLKDLTTQVNQCTLVKKLVHTGFNPVTLMSNKELGWICVLKVERSLVQVYKIDLSVWERQTAGLDRYA